MESNPVCPVCKANIIYRRHSSKELEIQIQKGNSIVINENTDNSSVDIYCSEDRTHEIGSITSSRVEQIVKSYGF
ncbi:MAG: hypothetical protein BWY74_00317 [Firmicutes bacterium ADurb.Bin419]|nr:MAG: hypothetical protein BWY74_00317 [Firmicutes bacterium ADurb.Bin419]